jgi:RsiW-degrading membrane proteinase PrsW (M82 family)
MSEDGQGRDLVECNACWRKTPPGAFCGFCGAHLPTTGRAGVNRRHAYAADPSRHVLVPEIVSTLLPHLPRRRGAPFRLALLIVVVLLVLLGVLQLSAAAIAVAAAAVPVIYLVYLYEVEVYQDDPILVIGLTVLGGAILGGLWAWFVGPRITQLTLITEALGLSLDRVMTAGILLPLAAQVLMLVPAIILFVIRGRGFDEALDGFTFGAAAALGFTLASTLVDLAPELAAGPMTSVSRLDNGLEIVTRGLALPVVNASTTGLICANLWLLRGRRRGEVYHILASLPSSATAAILAQGLLGVGAVALNQPYEQLLLYVVIGLLLLLLVRFALHSMLLAEAVEMGIGDPAPCSNCHHVVPRMAFCPSCGIASRATPKAGIGAEGRAVR